ncbi:hypothetical protein ScPMuIL_014869 [Solemya velum]
MICKRRWTLVGNILRGGSNRNCATSLTWQHGGTVEREGKKQQGELGWTSRGTAMTVTTDRYICVRCVGVEEVNRHRTDRNQGMEDEKTHITVAMVEHKIITRRIEPILDWATMGVSHVKDRKILIIGIVSSLILGFTIGILIGYFGIDNVHESKDGIRSTLVQEALTQDGDPGISDLLMNRIVPDNIRLNLQYSENTTSQPLPGIPAVTIGYGAAEYFLRIMGGRQAPEGWVGGIPVTYSLGPDLRDSRKIRLSTSNKNSRRKTYNAFGIIKGFVEPDRYVLMGNHRDAWVLGSIDPSSGTALMMEVSRVMGELVKSGEWKPRRSIIFCSWGAEEFGLIGSTEWVEEYIKNLENRAVAYINVDLVTDLHQRNHTLRSLGSPLLYDVIYDATKKVENPNPNEVERGHRSVFETWLENKPRADNPNSPVISSMGSGSDYAMFQMRAGVPSLDVRYTYRSEWGMSSYPLYHTAYETFHLVDQIMDRGFKFHAAVGRVCGEIIRSLSDSLIIPFNLVEYGNKLRENYESLVKGYGDIFHRENIPLDVLNTTIQGFRLVVTAFHRAANNVDKSNPILTRMINDQLIQFEGSFLDPAGLPGRPLYRHVIQSTSSANGYAGVSFPGLVDTVTHAQTGMGSWEEVKKHLSVVIFTIRSAASTLKEVTDFMRDERQSI